MPTEHTALPETIEGSPSASRSLVLPPSDSAAFDSLKPWQRIYLAYLNSPDPDDPIPEDTAVRAARVSVPIVMREVHANPTFDRLRQDAKIRRLDVGGLQLARYLARDGAPHIMAHVQRKAVNPAVRDRDQATFSKIALDAAGLGASQRPEGPGALPDAGALTIAIAIQLQQQEQRPVKVVRARVGSTEGGAEPHLETPVAPGSAPEAQDNP